MIQDASAAATAAVGSWALRLGWRILQIAGRLPKCPRREAQKFSMRQNFRFCPPRRHETLAFAKSMLAGIEANRLGLGEIELFAEMLSRPGRPVSGQKEVIGMLRCLLDDPNYRPRLCRCAEPAGPHGFVTGSPSGWLQSWGGVGPGDRDRALALPAPLAIVRLARGVAVYRYASLAVAMAGAYWLLECISFE